MIFLKPEMAIKSKVIDANELRFEELMTESEKDKSQETRQSKAFVIPKRIDLLYKIN